MEGSRVANSAAQTMPSFPGNNFVTFPWSDMNYISHLNVSCGLNLQLLVFSNSSEVFFPPIIITNSMLFCQVSMMYSSPW